MTSKELFTLTEIQDSLTSLIDVTQGLEGEGKDNVLDTLARIREQVNGLLQDKGK